LIWPWVRPDKEYRAEAAFIGLERLVGAEAKARARLDADRALSARVAKTLASLAEDGARGSPALAARADQSASMCSIFDDCDSR
jgi:hypothetical protein